MWKCPTCENEHDDSVATCPVDGTPRPDAETPRHAERQWTCPNCKAQNDGMFCGMCGRSRYASSVPVPPAEPQWRCARCNAENSVDSRYCFQCGTPKKSEASVPLAPPAPPAWPKGNDELREALEAAKSSKNNARIMALLCILGVLILFAIPYITGDWRYTVYHNIQGYNGDIEQICSVVALIFVALPAPFLLKGLDVRKRNLPFTIAAVSAGALTIYCFTIFFGSLDPNAVLLLVAAAEGGVVLLTRRYVKLLEEMDNILLRSGL